MPFDAHSGERLREERDRLELTQQEMADAAGVRREMWSKYERGVAVPGGDVFDALARMGIDLMYVLTGMRVSEAQKPIETPLSPREQTLLKNYRGADDEGRRAVETTASALAHKDRGKTKGKSGGK